MLFSVLISVYAGDNPIFFRRSLRSIYAEQSLKPNEIVVVCDGVLGDALNAVLSDFHLEVGNLLTVLRFDENRGLAWALNDGLKVCQYDMVARMDADDIALPDRFQRQVEFFEKYPDTDVLGCFLEEIEPQTEAKLGARIVPTQHEEIYSFGISRNPISHPTVMFRRSSVLAVGGYPLFNRSQDYALWSLMLAKGYKFANIPEYLLLMRTGQELFRRRGFYYFLQEAKILKFQKSVGFISLSRYCANYFGRLFLRIAPESLKAFLYSVVR